MSKKPSLEGTLIVPQTPKRRTAFTNFWTETRESEESKLPSWKGGLAYNTAARYRADRTLDWLNKLRDRSLGSSKLRALINEIMTQIYLEMRYKIPVNPVEKQISEYAHEKILATRHFNEQILDLLEQQRRDLKITRHPSTDILNHRQKH